MKTYNARLSLSPAHETPSGMICMTMMLGSGTYCDITFSSFEELKQKVEAIAKDYGQGCHVSVYLMPTNTRKPSGFDTFTRTLAHHNLEVREDRLGTDRASKRVYYDARLDGPTTSVPQHHALRCSHGDGAYATHRDPQTNKPICEAHEQSAAA